MTLHTLLQRADIWRGGEHALHGHGPAGAALASGYPLLDERLPGGGWPVGALTELLLRRPGIGEVRLLLPALARISQQRWIAWITPPHLLYAPALVRAGVDLGRMLVVNTPDPDERLWALEQALRSGVCGAVLAWPASVDPRSLRRLQLAAEAGTALGFLFRPEEAARSSSPAALRLKLSASKTGLCVTMLKQRGGWRQDPVTLEPRDAVA